MIKREGDFMYMNNPSELILFMAGTIKEQIEANIILRGESITILPKARTLYIQKHKNGYHIQVVVNKNIYEKDVDSLENFEQIMDWVGYLSQRER